MKILKQWLDAVFRFLDRNHISRRFAFYLSLWLTIDSYRWAKAFADAHADKAGSDVAMIIGAVLAAVSGLQGWMFKLYIDGRAQPINFPPPQCPPECPPANFPPPECPPEELRREAINKN